MEIVVVVVGGGGGVVVDVVVFRHSPSVDLCKKKQSCFCVVGQTQKSPLQLAVSKPHFTENKVESQSHDEFAYTALESCLVNSHEAKQRYRWKLPLFSLFPCQFARSKTALKAKQLVHCFLQFARLVRRIRIPWCSLKYIDK